MDSVSREMLRLFIMDVGVIATSVCHRCAIHMVSIGQDLEAGNQLTRNSWRYDRQSNITPVIEVTCYDLTEVNPQLTLPIIRPRH